MLGKKVNILLLTLLTLLSTAVSAAVNTQYNATVCGSGTYLFGCKQLTSSGTETNTLGDSTVTLHLLFAPLKATSYTATIEPGQTYLFGCQRLTADAVTSNTLQQVGCGCDSTVTLTLKVQAPAPTKVVVGYTATIQKGETYLFGCATYASDTTVSDTLHLTGKDSIVVLTLKVEDTPAPVEVKVGYTATIQKGETYLFGCATYASDTTVSDTLHLTGKDSIVVLTLKVEAPAPTEVKAKYEATIEPLQTYLFGCQLLTAAGEYADTLHLAGKDSITILTLKVAPKEVKAQYSSEITTEDTYLLGCKAYHFADPGLYKLMDTLHLAGIDSITIVNLTVAAGGGGQAAVTVAYTATIEYGQTYLFGCQQLSAAGTYYDTVPSLMLIGDSATILTLKVAPKEVKAKYETTIVSGETYLFGCQQLTAAGEYADTLHLAGKDSITILTLKVLPKEVKVGYSATIKQGETYLFGCKALTAAGDYADTLHLLGVDSITVLTLKVCQPDSSELSLTVCDSITWKGTKYTTSGDYTFDTLTVTGCDSVITLHLTVNHSDSSELSLTVCDSITWKGTKYTTSGDYTFDTLTVAGCDSVITLHLTVNHSVQTTEVIDTCNMYTWHGVRYTKTDIYYDTLQTVHGCDSICKLDLTITLPYQDTLTLEHYYGDRVIMINRHEINALGWKLDSLDLDHPEYVKWYRINAPGDTTFLDNGYYYTLTSGEPLPAGTYYAVIDIEPTGGARCGGKGVTEEYTVKGAAPAPALMPSLARPGQDIRIVNLNPMVQTNVRIYSADGLVQGSYTVSGEESYTIKAAGTTGFYLVELYNEDMKSTLRYIVK